jgi:hypothetical protein
MNGTRVNSRRDFLKKGVYVAPLILTLTAVPAFAGSGSGHIGGGHHDDGSHSGGHQPPGQGGGGPGGG